MQTATIWKNRVLAIVSWGKLNFKNYVSALLLWLVARSEIRRQVTQFDVCGHIYTTAA